ncbi:MAG: hypothetical protein SFU91_01895 [Chloroherpetonaceae bacterium]|nr:hypothetical protein [Chloroherpetonaceae bacterium]
MSLPNPLFFPECYFDLELLKALGIGRKSIDKGSSKGDVSKRLKKNAQPAVTLIGVVDEDPHSSKPDYFEEFQSYKKEHDVLFLKHRSDNVFLLILCPDIEHWLYKSALEAGIRPDEKPFQLPKRAKDLHDLRTGRKNVNDDKQVMNFLIEIIKSPSKRIEYLKKCLAEL